MGLAFFVADRVLCSFYFRTLACLRMCCQTAEKKLTQFHSCDKVFPSLNGKLKRYGSKRERLAQIKKYMARVGNAKKEYSKQKKKKFTTTTT
jgi:hypothetical protein